MSAQPKRYATVKGAAKYLGKHENQIRRYLKYGDLPLERLRVRGRLRTLIPTRAIEAFKAALDACPCCSRAKSRESRGREIPSKLHTL